MLIVTVLGDELYDEESQTFSTHGDVTVLLEHSLVSLSKWESIFEKPFLGPGEKTTDEVREYIKCMSLDPNIPPEVFSRMTKDNLDKINEYIASKMTATWFSEIKPAAPSREIITSELIYYWLVTFNIPFEAEHWHLNRLFTLIRVCNMKTAKPKKMSRTEMAQRNRELNAQRKAAYGTQG